MTCFRRKNTRRQFRNTGKRFYLYPPQFQDDVRINLVQVWDYFEDTAMDFHLLYTFERENKVFQTEEFTEHYFPVRRKLLLDKLEEMGYGDIQVMCHPAFYENVDLSRVAWYCVLAKKGGTKHHEQSKK